MWQHHFEFLLLGYGAYATFVELCKAHLPDIPDQHIAQMVAGIDVLLFKPDAELRRLARLALDTGVDGAFVEGRSPAEIDAELGQSEPGRSWLAELEQVKDPWFNMATGDGLYHYYRSWFDDPSIVAINASWGLGEAVVAGEVTPDEYLLSKVTGELVRRRIGDKLIEHVPAPAGGGTVRREVQAERRDAPCLADTELGQLHDLARRVERHFGSQQDIEWAIARAGGLFVLQSRPVTVAREQPRAPAGASAIALVMSTFGAGGTSGER